MDVGVSVMDLLVVGLGPGRSSQRGHCVRTGVFAQGSQRRGVWAQVGPSQADTQGPLWAADQC